MDFYDVDEIPLAVGIARLVVGISNACLIVRCVVDGPRFSVVRH